MTCFVACVAVRKEIRVWTEDVGVYRYVWECIYVRTGVDIYMYRYVQKTSSLQPESLCYGLATGRVSSTQHKECNKFPLLRHAP